MEDTTTCPGNFYCSDGSLSYNAISPTLHYLPAYAALISSFFSLIGAALNMIAYCAFKDLRKGTVQSIVAVLAMADFVLALSGLFGASIQLVYGNSTQNMLSEKHCYNFDTLCQIQAFVTMWMLGCSFTWTSVLALHFFLVTVCTRSTWPHKLMPLYNIVAWLLSLLSSVLLLLFGKLGFTPNYTWTCFIRINQQYSPDIAAGWYIIEFATVMCMIFGYVVGLLNIIHTLVSVTGSLLESVL